MAAQASPDLGLAAALAAVLVEHGRTLEALTIGSPCDRQPPDVSTWRRLGRNSSWR